MRGRGRGCGGEAHRALDHLRRLRLGARLGLRLGLLLGEHRLLLPLRVERDGLLLHLRLLRAHGCRLLRSLLLLLLRLQCRLLLRLLLRLERRLLLLLLLQLLLL